MSHSTMVTRALQLIFSPMKRRGTPPLVQDLLLLTIMNLKLMRGIIGPCMAVLYDYGNETVWSQESSLVSTNISGM